MSPLVHGAMCATCLGLGLTDLAWLDLHAAEMSPPAVVPREAPPAPPPPRVEPEAVALTLTSATVTGATAVTEKAAAGARAEPVVDAVIRFARNADEPPDTELEELDAIAAELARDPRSIVIVEGHTDRSGPADFNQTLSEWRAAGVARRLEQRGVPAARVRVRGFGASRPRDEGAGEEALRRNRRVEIHVRERGQP